MRYAVGLLVVAAVAHADNRADAMFAKGKTELAAKHYEAACKAFKASLDADPTAIGTMLNLGRCYEEWGRLATGLTWYENARTQAAKVHDNREQQIATRIKSLAAQVPRITIHIRGAATGATVELDGVPLATDQVGTPVRVDPGPHVVAVEVGGEHRERTVPVEPGGNADVQLDAPTPAAVAPSQPQPDPAVPPTAGGTATSTSPDPGHGKRVAGIALGASGAVAMLVAGGITVVAKSHYDAAIKGDCSGSRTTCDPQGLSATGSARKEANVATGVFAGGAALVAGGALLYYLARPHESVKEHAVRVVPSVGGIGIAGSF
jgi:hypothetical protein